MRTSRVALVALVAAGALSLSACIFPGPPDTLPPQGDETIDGGSGDRGDAAPQPGPPADGAYDFQIDDNTGDTWSFTVRDLEEDPPLEDGAPDDGERAVAIVLDARHDDGGASFVTCFDFAIIGDDGNRYEFMDTFESLLAVDDVYEIGNVDEGETFAGARATIVLPDAVEPVRIEVISDYGDETAVVDVP